MLNKSLLNKRLISFRLILAAKIEFNIKKKCLEIGTVLFHSFPLIHSYSTFKALLKCCILWEVFLDADPLLRPPQDAARPFLRALTIARISHR